MKDFPVAIASYSFHAMHGEGRCDVFDYLDMLRYRYQLHHADLWCGYLPTLEDDFIAKVRRAMDDRTQPIRLPAGAAPPPASPPAMAMDRTMLRLSRMPA